MLIQLIITLLILPIIGFIGCILLPRRWERAIFSITLLVLSLEFVVLALAGYQWLAAGAAPVAVTIGSLPLGHLYTFSLELYFDILAAVFFGMTVVMIMLISIFSKYYLHREQGFKRFYSTLFLFLTGLTLIILAGNFETLFVGWEFIGMSSVLLIAFYRDRFLPARNSLKVFSIYRIGDAFLLAAILYAHHLFEKNIAFAEFSTLAAHYGNQLAVLGLLLLVVALVKSAQFPFSYWLPRAMEGPTTSSAIFYGALSVHMGLYLLLRTYPLWEGSLWLRVVIALSGLVTAIVASSIARVQSSAKTQIAYASITQIGIMFIELAAGLEWLALLHFVSNAALRTYQLLISPSVVSYLIHDQFFYFTPPIQKIKDTFIGKVRGTLYVLGIKEWNMNTAMRNYLWGPLKSVGRYFGLLDKASAQVIAVAAFLAVALIVTTVPLSSGVRSAIATGAIVASILFYLRAYAMKHSAATCWNLIGLGHVFGALFLAVASRGSLVFIALYGVGVAVAFVAGHICLWYVAKKGDLGNLREYQGAIYAFANVGNLFFIVSLLFMAFPISPSFLGQDVLLSLLPGDYVLQTVLFCLAYLIMGVSVMRLYIKVFFGPHKASYHEKAYISS